MGSLLILLWLRRHHARQEADRMFDQSYGRQYSENPGYGGPPPQYEGGQYGGSQPYEGGAPYGGQQYEGQYGQNNCPRDCSVLLFSCAMSDASQEEGTVEMHLPNDDCSAVTAA